MSINNLLEENLFSTSDLSLAAAILVYYPVQAINKENAVKVFFIFQKDRNFDSILEQYWRGDLKIEPRQYFNNLKMLKSRIYNY